MSSDVTPTTQSADFKTVLTSLDPHNEATRIESNSTAKRLTRQHERDLAFALSAIETGHLTHKQITGLVKDWTIHGDLSLSEHLTAKAALTPEECLALEELAEQKLQRSQSRARSDQNSSSLSPKELLIKHLDQNGKIAECLGLSFSAVDDLDSPTRVTNSEFRLLKKLGQGGLGIVWLARDENLKRLVAIKEILRSTHENSPEVRRFRREAEITGRLEHPSIVPIHQFGTDQQSDQPFYVMRYIGKRTLENAIDEFHERRLAGQKDHLQLHYLLTSFVSICQAIAYAHSKNVIHRDLKPENVVLDSYGQVIVLDWGLAKLTGELDLIESSENFRNSGYNLSDQTQDGQILGTPMYMSPEQATGRLDDINELTDVYGLGAILFSILTGFAPHDRIQGNVSSRSTISELLRSIVSQEPPAASSLNPDTPPELEAICSKALSVKSYNRYQSAAELAEEIQRWMAGEPVSAYIEPWKTRTARWIGNHRLLSQICAALLTILVVSGVTFGIATRNAMEVERHARFEALKSQSHQLVSKVESRSEELVKNVRFMSTLPPIEGIIQARSEDKPEEAESEEIWVKRLQSIYMGLLEANPQYLSVSFWVIDPENSEQSTTPLVRVERRRALGSRVHIVPTARLQPVTETPVLRMIRSMQPEDVYQEEITQQEINGVPSTFSSVIISGTPVYDQKTGTLFGIVTIEIDLETGLRALLEGFVQQGQHAYVINSSQRILLYLDPQGQFQVATRGMSSEVLPADIQKYLQNDNAPDMFTDGSLVVAQKIRLNDTPNSKWLCFLLISE